MGQLDGVRILLTRDSAQTDTWIDAVQSAGATAVAVPLVRTRRIHPKLWKGAKHAIEGAADAKVAVGLASANAAEHWVAMQSELARPLEVIRTIVVGEATAERARSLGLTVEVASEANATGLAQKLLDSTPVESPVILPRALGGRNEGVELLRQKGRKVIAVEVYETVPVKTPQSEDCKPVDWTIIASPSAARAYQWHCAALTRMGLVVPQTRHAAIGITTAHAARQVGLAMQAVSPSPSIGAMLEAIGIAMAASSPDTPAP